ncbi:unnamed protein product, partial [Ectocarpus sp. 12 AP-2014]
QASSPPSLRLQGRGRKGRVRGTFAETALPLSSKGPAIGRPSQASLPKARCSSPLSAEPCGGAWVAVLRRPLHLPPGAIVAATRSEAAVDDAARQAPTRARSTPPSTLRGAP